MNEAEIKQMIEQIGYQEFYRYFQEKTKLITNLQEENQKLVKVVEELETWLSEKQDLTCGCGITRDYIYAYENVLDKLTELKGGNNDEI